MNYRHSFHAGNFADVLKHVALCALARAMTAKGKRLLALDTHGGAGLYRLADIAGRSSEAADGVGRLQAAPRAGLGDLIGDYLALVDSAGAGLYPGSPWLLARLIGREDRLVVCELHPETRELLAETLRGERRARVLGEDGYHALRSQLPPIERRALILIDPPFESRDEFESLAAEIPRALERLPAAVIAIWYPVKDLVGQGRFLEAVESWGRPALRLELALAPPRPDGRMSACGLVILNPPYGVAERLRAALPILADQMRGPTDPTWRCDWLVADR